MKQRNSHTIFFAIAMIIIVIGSGCTKYLEFEGENAKPRLVANGLMRPDSNFTVELSNSLGYIDIGNIQLLENGKVAVFDSEGNFVDSLIHQGQGRYRSNAVPQAGETYTIRVQAGNFPEATATDIIPLPIPIAGWDTLTSTQSEFGFESRSLTVFVDINDPANEENFYMLELYENYDPYYLEERYENGIFVGYDTIYIGTSNNPICLSTSDPILMNENDIFAGDIELFACRILFTDRLFNGQNRRFSVKLEYFSSTELEIRLTTLSSDYYKYVRTLERYEFTEGDPFAEPVQVFSNMSGDALGIWGGASYDSEVISFE